MSAVLRVWWTFFTASPMQRWFGAFGCALLALGCTLLALGFGARPLTEDATTPALWAFVGFAGFATFTAVPTVVMTGGLLRALSAPSSHRLYPRLRLRLLISVALLVATLMAVLLAVVAANPQVFRSFSLSSAAVAILAASTATIITLFIVTRHWNLTWPIFALFMAVPFWVNSGGPDRIRATGFSMTAVVGVLTAAAWIVFAAAYLRAARIEPMRLVAAGGKLRDGAAGTPLQLSRGSACRSLLGGKLDRPLPQALLTAFGIGVAIALGAALLRLLPGAQVRQAPLLNFIWPALATFAIGALGERAVRQSRLLWLHTAGARRDTLRVTEAFLARLYLFVIVVVLTVAALAPFLWHTTPLVIVLLVATSASAALCAAYLVLFALGGVLISIGGFVSLLLAQVTFLQVFGAPVLGALLLIGLQLGAAIVLRFAAIWRWHTVDWLKFRPFREQRVL
jgi:hypothetical protein